jgi:hypothetical protein
MTLLQLDPSAHAPWTKTTLRAGGGGASVWASANVVAAHSAAATIAERRMDFLTAISFEGC